MEKKELYNQIMESVSKEVKKALNENTNENIDMFDYREWKRENGLFLEKFIKEYLTEHLSIWINYGYDDISAGLNLDEDTFTSDRDSDPNDHCGYEE